ncbi:MAG TPA: dihydrolipoamide acetyltransferase family protein [Bacilli bacterium]|nr:dihydrolipoamide acetyltransferase family protein [Bacilli bacterium]
MYDFKFSDIGEGLHEGTILKWHVKVGDKVKEGDTLVEIETDKVNAELPSPVDGVIMKLGADEGVTINVGETVAIIDDGSGAEVADEPAQETEAVTEESAPGVIGEIEVSSEIIGSSNEVSAPSVTTNTKAKATPAARKVARDLGVDINKVIGTGPSGRVMKDDIRAFANNSAATPVVSSVPSLSFKAGEGTTRVPITKLRKAIVNAMTVSKQVIPHTVLIDEVIIDKLVNLRNDAKNEALKQGIKLTYMAFIIKAVTMTLKEFPLFNASFDQNTDEMIMKHFMNIGIAVDTPDGLIVPNIKDADTKSIFSLARELRETADLTISRKVSLAALQNTTFTITNFGSAGISFGTPIINHPEVAILGVGMINKKPVVIDDEIRVGYVLPLSLAVDHRVIDGADAGRFLNRVKALLSEPTLLLME